MGLRVGRRLGSKPGLDLGLGLGCGSWVRVRTRACCPHDGRASQPLVPREAVGRRRGQHERSVRRRRLLCKAETTPRLRLWLRLWLRLLASVEGVSGRKAAVEVGLGRLVRGRVRARARVGVEARVGAGGRGRARVRSRSGSPRKQVARRWPHRHAPGLGLGLGLEFG